MFRWYLSQTLGSISYIVGAVPYLLLVAILGDLLISFSGIVFVSRTTADIKSSQVLIDISGGASNALLEIISYILGFAAILLTVSLVVWLPIKLVKYLSALMHRVSKFCFHDETKIHLFIVKLVFYTLPVVVIATGYVVQPKSLFLSMMIIGLVTAVVAVVLAGFQVLILTTIKAKRKSKTKFTGVML